MEAASKLELLIKNYKPGPQAADILKAARLLLVVAITAAGKNTLIQELIKTGDFYFMVSHTTRKPRMNKGEMEKDGIHYHFVDHKKIIDMLEKGELLECKLVHGRDFYGVSLAEIAKATKLGKIGTSDVEVQGVDEFMKKKPDTTAVFILPPSLKEWQRRLASRNAHESAEELNRRFASAKMELETALARKYYHFLINDNLAKAVSEVKQLVNGEAINDADGRKLAKQLLAEISKL